MKVISAFLAASTVLWPSSFVHAADGNFIEWQSTNVQLLRGQRFELGSERQTIVTFEHANRWKYGDFFAFADQIWQDNGSSAYYFEPNLRVSLSKVSGHDLSFGLVKDVLLSGQMEKPEGQDERWLGGVAVDLNIPNFTFFKVNMFLRDNPNLAGHTHQATIAWNRPFKIGDANLLFEGFADIAGSEGTASSYELVVPRLLVDVGDLAGVKKNKVWAGVEWQYWHNKFGVNGVTESVPQAQVKYVF